ncbi:lactate racemase domain-containing protein [Oligosphaera ethanolica]|uniref:Nickel-dependent lactate racemase n=1 Tax=Oligosphaera ethanolica TaxID=760260 RepID=A0AAE3VH47_9BACT|nr:lactate racemase domain-containing protein [Oligosphaera ethanolica]MDQ0290280.1 nickel-dependent lactate racemase [Oligosphaera ethanolica]
MTTYAHKAGTTLAISDAEKLAMLRNALAQIDRPLKKVLIIPPDFTRLNSNAGPLTNMLYKLLSPTAQVDIIPALGTHFAMTEHEIKTMFGADIPLDRFIVHDWRNDVVTLGEVPGSLIKEWSEGKLDYSVQVQCNKILFQGYDLILSVGQIVPHEVVGMANYTKNIMVGVGGSDMINKSHFIGASCNMEKIMGVNDTPVRKLFNYGCKTFLGDLPILYVLTVMAKNQETKRMDMRGLFIGDDDETFAMGVKLSQQVNLDLMDEPVKKAVVYLDPEEFKSTWLGNKAIYRTRMMIADDGDLIILAPALKQFGEDPQNDRVIRKYGYHGTPATLKAVAENEDLRQNLGAAAHLIHGSSEGRFRITYCPGPNMPKEDLVAAGFDVADLDTMMQRYDPNTLKDGFNTLPNGEKIFYISNPALGLWALREKFQA